jgi:hypothetical protein
MDEGEECLGQLVVASGDTAGIFQTIEALLGCIWTLTSATVSTQSGSISAFLRWPGWGDLHPRPDVSISPCRSGI